ncbi:MAG TPA: hypothetical protein PL041_12925, partial [Melioribacteraceae bacterium]|nr:hypothetical protein [Melioribacteraceae bacterium]
MQKIGTKIIPLLLGLMTVLTGCFDSPKEPVMPTWDAELNVPLVDKNLALHEIIDTRDNPNLGIDPTADSLYFIYVSNLETKARITDSLKMDMKLVPDTLNLSGQASGGEVKSAIIYNPDKQYHLLKAEFKSGTFLITLNNSSTFPVNYQLILPGFKKKSDGSVLKITGTVSASTKKNVEIPLKDYNYAELNIAAGLNDLTEPYTFQAAPGFYFVGIASATGAFEISFASEIKSGTITISRMEGQIKRTSLPFSSQQFSTGFGDEITNFKDAIDFENITVNVTQSIFGEMDNLRIVIDSLALIGYDQRKNGSLFDPLAMRFGTKNYLKDSLSTEEEYKKVFDKSNSNVSEFLLHLPRVLKMGSKFTIAPIPGLSQVISDTDSFKIVTNINAPLSLRSKNATYKDTLDIEITEDNRDQIKKGNNASLVLEIENHIPLGLTGSAMFVDANYRPLFSVHTDGGSTSIDVPPSDISNTGFASTPSVSKTKLVLTKQEIDLFSQAKYVIAQVFIRSTGS